MTNINTLKREISVMREYNEEIYKKWVQAEREKEILLKELKKKDNQQKLYFV